MRCLPGGLIALFVASCATPPEVPPVILPKGGKAHWGGKFTYWDRNGDGKADRLRDYWGSGYAREYFDDDFDGSWDGMEHARGSLATGSKEKRAPEGLSEQDRMNIASALEECIQAKRK